MFLELLAVNFIVWIFLGLLNDFFPKKFKKVFSTKRNYIVLQLSGLATGFFAMWSYVSFIGILTISIIDSGYFTITLQKFNPIISSFSVFGAMIVIFFGGIAILNHCIHYFDFIKENKKKGEIEK